MTSDLDLDICFFCLWLRPLSFLTRLVMLASRFKNPGPSVGRDAFVGEFLGFFFQKLDVKGLLLALNVEVVDSVEMAGCELVRTIRLRLAVG